MEDAMPLIEIRAGKLCGVFYSSQEPKEPPYVQEGDVITEGATLCIIDMMKSMNHLVWTPEISRVAEVVWKKTGEPFTLDGDITATIRAVHAKNEASVEPGQLLFELEVAGESKVPSPKKVEEAPAIQETVENSRVSNRIEITSRYVGWFYSAPPGTTTPYVQVGDMVEPGQILCRVHALQHDDLIRAPDKSIVRERCEEEGISVDYGRHLFILELIDN